MTDRFDWDSLKDLPASSWQDGSVTQRLLDHTARISGGRCLAVYSQTEDGWGRVAQAGAEPAPTHLAELPSDAHPLPGGLALLREGGEPFDSPALDALLTAGVQLQRLDRQVKRQSFQQGLHTVKLQALYDVGLAIARTLNLDDLTEEILMHAVALLDARRGALFLIEEDGYRLQRAIGGDAVETLPIDDRAVVAVEKGEQAPGDSFLPGVTHFMAVPIETDGRSQGILVIGDKESRTGVGPFNEEDQRSLSLFASQAAIALENARLHRQAIEKERLDREMELAAEIQRGLLPSKLPQSGSLESIGWNRPTQHVGGDYFGSFQLAEGKTGFVVADVTGKGMPAALLVSTLHSALRLLLDRGESSEQLLSGLNQHIHESSSSNKFITLILALLDNQREEFEFVNAGHNPGLLVRADGRVEELGAGGVPLGLLAGSAYVKELSTLSRGDLLCLYSDGITECEAPDDEQYGQERLEEFLRERRAAPLKEILSDMDRAVRDWAAGRPQGDDQTVILLRRI